MVPPLGARVVLVLLLAIYVVHFCSLSFAILDHARHDPRGVAAVEQLAARRPQQGLSPYRVSIIDRYDPRIQELETVCASWASRGIAGGQGDWEEAVCIEPSRFAPAVGCPPPLRGGVNSARLPMVAVLAGVSTRGVSYKSVNDIATFQARQLTYSARLLFLLPSVARTAECGFRYSVVLGYDLGDAFYDTPSGQDMLQRWFLRNVLGPLKRANLDIELVLVGVKNDIKKPGPVFNAAASVAYDRGAEYFFRVNDDSELLNPWAYKFARELQGMGAPYGVVGPSCNESNTKILNHDFTHRTHMEIFNGSYYPPQLTDWYMDDWISMTYGSGRTRQLTSVEILHHTRSQNVRYTVDFYRKEYLGDLVEDGKRKVLAFMGAHGIPQYEQDRFNASRFDNFPIEKVS